MFLPSPEDRVKLWRHIRALDGASPPRLHRHATHVALADGDAANISYIAHGKDNTLIFAADKLHQLFPKDALVRLKTCRAKKDGVDIRVGDTAALERNGVDSSMVLKRVSNQELAIIEADICEFLWRQFGRARAMHACSLHPGACRLDVRMPTVMGPPHSDSGVRMVPMRRFALSAASAMRRWPKDAASRGRLAIGVAQAVLEPLRILHGLDFVHLDVKPANILLPESADDIMGATLTDYETLLRSEDLLERVDVNRDIAIYVGTVRYMSPVLSLKASSLFRATCIAAGLSPAHPSVHAGRSAFDTPSVCDMHSLAMTLAELAGAHQNPPPPAVARAIRRVLCARNALECPDLLKGRSESFAASAATGGGRASPTLSRAP
jgi:hypothetical protein